MRSRWNWVGAGFGVLLASLSFFMRHSGSAATGFDLASMLRPGDDKLVVAQNADNAGKPTPRPAPKPKAPTAKPSTPAAPEAETPAGAPQGAPIPQAGPDPLGELQPVLHAQGAKITTCMDTIINQASSVIDTTHTAISTWVTSAPNDNAFQSTVGLSYPNKSAPNAAAILFAAPVGPGRCEGETVQIYPTAQACSLVQANLIKEGHTLATLQALPVVETKTGARDILLPSAGGGCVIVAIGLK
jgi:hypothetical protein